MNSQKNCICNRTSTCPSPAGCPCCSGNSAVDLSGVAVVSSGTDEQTPRRLVKKGSGRGESDRMLRVGSGNRKHFRRPGSVVSDTQSITPYTGKTIAPMDGPLSSDDASDDYGGGQARSYKSRDSYSLVSGSTISSHHRRFDSQLPLEPH